MKIKELEKYKPITFKLRKRLSDHEMKSNSEQFYENISSRHIESIYSTHISKKHSVIQKMDLYMTS